LGQQGEALAAQFLEQLGYRIRERNYRCRIGEIDIIAEDQEYLVFCEVKTRRDSKVHPSLSVSARKIHKLQQLGLWYQSQQGLTDRQPRFDVISVQLDEPKPLIEHIVNAF
jgi:putative endonuclease